jgi:1-acyl-sn-glycerol-3-phosphate acyltransferase
MGTPMRFVVMPFRFIYCIYAFTLFILLLILVFPFAFVASFWGKLKGGHWIYRFCRLWAELWIRMIGIRHANIDESPWDRGKQYIFVANHISYLDIPLILCSTGKQPLRILGKFELRRVPLFGFIYRNAVIMVDRSNPNERTKSLRQLKSVLRKGISIFIFPEGTFNETGRPLKDFYDGAFRLAIETGTPIKPILFLDTYDRMSYSSIFTLSPGRARSIFLEEISANGLSLNDMGILKKKVFDQMEAKLNAYGARWIKRRDDL